MHGVRCTLGIVVVALLVAVSGIASTLPAGAAVARISVGPSKNLVDGQVVTVTLFDFPPNSALRVFQCAKNATNVTRCDAATQMPVVTGPHGGGTTPFIVEHTLRVPSPTLLTPVDCTKTTCKIVVVIGFPGTFVAAYPVTMNPSAPLAPPLTFGISINPTGTVNTTTHVATIGGTATCNRAAFVEINGQVAQLIPFQGVSLLSVSEIDPTPFLCTAPSTPWSKKVGDLSTAAYGSILVGFKPGNVKVQLSAFAHAPRAGSLVQFQSRTVTLTASS
jgi:hypothetical protein